MSRHSYSWFVTLSLVVFLLQAAAPRVAGQVRPAPGAVRVPGTTVAREVPLRNWSEVTMSEVSFGSSNPVSKEPFRTFSLESVEGSQHWVERSYHWPPNGLPVVDDTKVHPTASRMVHAVTGYYQQYPYSGWYGWPTIRFGLLVPVAGARLRASRVSPPKERVNAAALQRIPVAQTMGYQRLRVAPPARVARPGAPCHDSTEYPPNSPPLQASCVLLEPGQSVDLPNQTRILRVGNNYRVIVGGSLMEDLYDVTIIHTEGRYYTLRDLGVH
jgi:hypothetical protein